MQALRFFVLVLVSTGFLMGCGATVSTSPLTDTLTATTATTGANAMSSVVAGDVAEAYRDFVADAGTARGIHDAPAGLSDGERAQIEDLRAQLDDGTITAEQFATSVDAILGDHFASGAFAGREFFGAAFPRAILHRLADRLGLTDEQLASARTIFQDTHSQIRLATLETLANIRLQLSDEQRAELDALRADHFAAIREQLPPPARPAIGRGARGARLAAGRERMHEFFDALADKLALTDDQRTTIQGMRDELRAKIKELHQAARDQFRALLTDDQKAILDQIEQQIEQRRGQNQAETTK